jgi:DNA-directed RNA polymerase subunit RPC12/RpoP
VTKDSGDECDHRRGLGRGRTSAITVCRSCRDYLCSTCGLTIEWREGLLVTNPVVQWRYCGKPACVEAEAAYHGLPLDVMPKLREALRATRMLRHLQDRRNVPRPPLEVTVLPSGAECVKWNPLPFTLDPGEACWCNRGKDCDGSHEVGSIEVVNRCAICGKTLQSTLDDPHWSTGRGPICPDDGRLS